MTIVELQFPIIGITAMRKRVSPLRHHRNGKCRFGHFLSNNIRVINAFRHFFIVKEVLTYRHSEEKKQENVSVALARPTTMSEVNTHKENAMHAEATINWDDVQYRVFKFCLRRLRHREDAEDAAQDVILAAWKSRDKIEGDFFHYATGIARRICADRIEDRDKSRDKLDLFRLKKRIAKRESWATGSSASGDNTIQTAIDLIKRSIPALSAIERDAMATTPGAESLGLEKQSAVNIAAKYQRTDRRIAQHRKRVLRRIKDALVGQDVSLF